MRQLCERPNSQVEDRDRGAPTLVLGDVSVGLVTSDDRMQRWLGRMYPASSPPGTLDWLVRIVFFPPRTRPVAADLEWVARSRGRVLDIYVLGDSGEDRKVLVNVILHAAFRHIRNVARKSQFLMHGGLVLVEGMGLIFTGPSGVGKTTFCRLIGEASLGARVLTDEKVCISKTERGFEVCNTPLGGDMRQNEVVWVPLTAVFLLRQATEPSVRALRLEEAISTMTGQLTPEFRIPGLLSDGALDVDLAASASRCVPCYEIGFRPDLSFWPCVELALATEKEGAGVDSPK